MVSTRTSLLMIGAFGLALAAPVACNSSPSSDAADAGAEGADAAAKSCVVSADCPSEICTPAKVCAAPTPTDGVKNNGESDIDCGGANAPRCDVQKKCTVGTDCGSGVCADTGAGLACQPPSSTDGVKNGAETDVDCGGVGNPQCTNGKACGGREDCSSDVCLNGACTAPAEADGVKNGTETDVDCGGPAAPRCTDLKACNVADDCASSVCTGNVCQIPTPTDGVKNGAETDVDCGGAGNPKCVPGKSCKLGDDCTKGACNYDKKCEFGRSCIAHYGGDTCGVGEVGQAGAQHESCCLTAPVTVGNTTVQLDKYQVTAGRMRAFLESINGDVRGFVQTARQQGKIPANPANAAQSLLAASWDLYLPSSFAGNTNPPPQEVADGSQGDPNTLQNGVYTAIYRHLGGFIFKGNAQTLTGCEVKAPGTHTYWFPDNVQTNIGDVPHKFDQSVYDAKALNCVDYLVAQAFCVWDGGRLETIAEWQAAWGAGVYPWGATPIPKPQTDNTYNGCRFPTVTDQLLRTTNPGGCPAALIPAANESIEYADYKYSYEYPTQKFPDYVSFISAPGRTRGRGPNGHADVLANQFELTSTLPTYNADPRLATHRWSGNGSWEGHAPAKAGGGTTMLLNKYGKLGLRCAHP